MAYKLGLKLWSINTDYYYEEAQRLFSKGVFDYIELYVVPNTLATLSKWKELQIPFIIHAPHFAHGFNLAKKEKEESNFKIYKEVKQFADELNAQYIIFHGGIDGDINETARQLAAFNEIRALIENKPYVAPLGEKRLCRGFSIQEVKRVIKKANCGFCLDIGHAICSANSQKIELYEYLSKFNELNPCMYHISGNFIDSDIDRHLHLWQGDFNFKRIFDIINKNCHLSIETNKDSKTSLNDFEKDIEYIAEFIREIN